MSFFENLGKKAAEVAQSAARKSGDLVEITKLTLSIANEEENLKSLYEEIGKSVYTKYTNHEEVPAELKETCEKIKGMQASVTELKNKIMQVKNLKLCSQCNEEVEKTVAFCPKCGAKQEVVEEPVVVQTTKTCSSCGKEAESGDSFCSSCGSKL